MVVFGVGEVVGAFVEGYIVDSIGSKKTCFFNTIILIITTILFLGFLIINQYNALTYLTTFFWGF